MKIGWNIMIDSRVLPSIKGGRWMGRDSILWLQDGNGRIPDILAFCTVGGHGDTSPIFLIQCTVSILHWSLNMSKLQAQCSFSGTICSGGRLSVCGLFCGHSSFEQACWCCHSTQLWRQNNTPLNIMFYFWKDNIKHLACSSGIVDVHSLGLRG